MRWRPRKRVAAELAIQDWANWQNDKFFKNYSTYFMTILPPEWSLAQEIKDHLRSLMDPTDPANIAVTLSHLHYDLAVGTYDLVSLSGVKQRNAFVGREKALLGRLSESEYDHFIQLEEIALTQFCVLNQGRFSTIMHNKDRSLSKYSRLAFFKAFVIATLGSSSVTAHDLFRAGRDDMLAMEDALRAECDRWIAKEYWPHMMVTVKLI